MGIAASFPGLAHAGSIRGRRWDGEIAAIVVGVVAAIGLSVSVAAGVVPLAAGLTVSTLIPAALIDLRERRLPDAWVGAAAAVFVVISTVGWVIGATPTFGRPLLGAAIVAGPILGLHLLSPNAMGFGDVKAAAVIGMAVGSVEWQLGLVVLTLAAGTAAAVGVAFRARTIAFGPFLVFGAWLALVGSRLWLPSLTSGGVG